MINATKTGLNMEKNMCINLIYITLRIQLSSMYVVHITFSVLLMPIVSRKVTSKEPFSMKKTIIQGYEFMSIIVMGIFLGAHPSNSTIYVDFSLQYIVTPLK